MHLSFIIACYNAEKYIARTIDSIFEGGHFSSINVEVIAINDGSTDSTLEQLQLISQKHNLTVIDHQNRGVGYTKNIGLDMAQGTYVMILDADDWIDASVVASVLNFSLNNNIDILSFGMQFVSEKLEKLHQLDIYPGPYEKILTGKQILLNGYQPSSVCSFLMHKKFFREYQMRFYDGTQLDVEISTRLLLKAERVYFSRKIGYFYFRNEGSITKSVNIEKLKYHLHNGIRIAVLGKVSIDEESDTSIKKVLLMNNNSIVWNLLWRFISNPKEVDLEFKLMCINELKAHQLYPIEKPLKSNFQKLTSFLFNQEWLLKMFLTIRSNKIKY